MTKVRHSLLALTLLMFAAAPAQAAIIDFTDEASWGGAQGTTTTFFTSLTTYDGVMVSVATADLGQAMTFNAADAHPLCSFVTGGVLACDGDGLGIGDDEIGHGSFPPGAGERILVTFSQPVDVTRFALLDLYGHGPGDASAEVARWAAITVGSPIPIEGSLTGTGFFLGPGLEVGTVSLPSTVAMLFFTSSPAPSNSDFALAAIEMTPTAAPIPEPATLVLTGAGLFAAASRARLRRRV